MNTLVFFFGHSIISLNHEKRKRENSKKSKEKSGLNEIRTHDSAILPILSTLV